MARSRPRRLAAIVVLVAGIGLGACGDDDDTVTPSTGASTTVVPTRGSTTTVRLGTLSTVTVPVGTTVDYVFRDGQVASGKGRVSVKLGEEITVRVVSDVAEEVHVHTYDLTVDLEPGVPGAITFKADIPGVHEVELENSHLRLFSLEVR